MSEPVVTAHQLCKRFGNKIVLDDVCLSAHVGDVIGVLGKNGAGKTTLLEVLLGFSRMSVGERHKLSVVLALAHHPEFIVLDEPVASLDPIARRDFLRQLLDIAELSGRCVVFSSHIISDLERAANKLWILKDGRLAWAGELDNLKERVVRLHVRTKQELKAPAEWPGLLSSRIDGARGVFTVSNWSAAEEARISALFSAPVESEPMGLEEIFMELHR